MKLGIYSDSSICLPQEDGLIILSIGTRAEPCHPEECRLSFPEVVIESRMALWVLDVNSSDRDSLHVLQTVVDSWKCSCGWAWWIIKCDAGR